jgi:hypothetical protein
MTGIPSLQATSKWSDRGHLIRRAAGLILAVVAALLVSESIGL